jgi:hypothetical protein
MQKTASGLAQYTGQGARAHRFLLPDGSKSFYVSGDYGQIVVTPAQYAMLKRIAPADFMLIPAALFLTGFTLSNPTIYIEAIDNYHKEKLLASGDLSTVGRVLADREVSMGILGADRYGAVYLETFGIDEPDYDDLWISPSWRPG